MKNGILLGLGRHMIPVPGFVWTRVVTGQTEVNLDFMSLDHHQVRDYVVRAMPQSQGPISPETIAAELEMALERVIEILDELEKRMTFLYRENGSAVNWAYPMTSDVTPHLVSFDEGEQVYAA